jgi:hypothetical protein
MAVFRLFVLILLCHRSGGQTKWVSVFKKKKEDVNSSNHSSIHSSIHSVGWMICRRYSTVDSLKDC